MLSDTTQPGDTAAAYDTIGWYVPFGYRITSVTKNTSEPSLFKNKVVPHPTKLKGSTR